MTVTECPDCAVAVTLHSELCILHSNGAVAGSCTRTSSVAGRHSPLKSQPRNSKGRQELFRLPARAISTKNKHLLLSCDTNPRFHGGSFGVLRHTSHKALKM